MTQSQLLRSVAGRTGESIGTLRRLGFGILAAEPGGPEPGDMHPVVDCPSCSRPVPYPGRGADGLPALAACAGPGCDLYFDFDPARVYATRSSSPSSRRP